MPARLLAAATLLLGASLARASVVDIVWDEDGRFQYVGEVATGEVAEVCGALSREQRVQWAFDASAAVDFNIHYHVGDDAVYPTTISESVESAGVLAAPVDQTYCWMWTRPSGDPATVTLQLSR